MMKKKPSVILLAALSTLVFSTGLQAQLSREADRIARRKAQQAAATPTEEPAPAEQAPASEVVVQESPAEVVTETVVVPATPLAEPPAAPEVVEVVETPEVAPPAVAAPAPDADLAALQAEVERDPRSYRNDHYGFELTDKGFLRRLTLADGTVALDSAGAVNLQGSYVTPEGRRVWFYAGGVGNSTYTATSTKTVRDGAVVFDVEVKHPRFTQTSSYVCRPDAIEVSVTFKPGNLLDQRGPIQGVYALQLWPAALEAGASVQNGDGEVTFATKQGPLVVSYEKDGWSVDGAEGRTVRVGDTGVAFNFDHTVNPETDGLRYTIKLP